MPILTTVENQVRYAEDRVSRAAARAGLPEDLIRPAGSTATALAEALAGRALVLCAEPFVRRHGAGWAPLADASLHRGYDVTAAQRRRGAAEVPGWLIALLAAAIGAVTGVPAAGTSRAAGKDVLSRLAARG